MTAAIPNKKIASPSVRSQQSAPGNAGVNMTTPGKTDKIAAGEGIKLSGKTSAITPSQAPSPISIDVVRTKDERLDVKKITIQAKHVREATKSEYDVKTTHEEANNKLKKYEQQKAQDILSRIRNLTITPSATPYTPPTIPDISNKPAADLLAMADKIIADGYLANLQTLCRKVDPNLLLLKAFAMGNASVCRWLLKNPAIQKATVNGLPQQKPEQIVLKKWLLAFLDAGPVTPAALKRIALEQGYGFKSGNLMVLQAMASALNRAVDSKGAPLLAKCHVEIPSFVPVSNFEITQHILKHDPKIVEMWQKFKRSFEEDQVKAFLGSQQPAQEQITVTDQGLVLLKLIGVRMESLFQRHPLVTPELQEWLQTNEGKQVIVRSTGKEDSDELANAGGNESIPFVKPDIASLNAAIGRVIGSYFCDPVTKAPRSIQQRLAAGDKTIFTEPPFMPVLLQQMVMENPDDPKTMMRSGVIFSRPQADFTDAVLIQTGLGNNHGVVNSEVAVDTYSVENQRIQAVVRNKSSRFAHVPNRNGGFSLQRLPNQPDIARTQALSKDAIKELAAIAAQIATLYGAGKKKSMDMEYSIQADPGTAKLNIYLLQARPLKDTENEGKQPKTYLDLKTIHELSKRKSEDVAIGKTLLDGNSHVRFVTSGKQVLMADELATALQIYLSSPDRNNIQAIIIRRKALLTSHAAVTLRPFGIPVLTIESSTEYEKARTILENSSEENPSLLCPQRAVVSGTNNVAPNIRDFIRKGLVTYPGASEISVPMNKGLAVAMASKDKSALNNYLKEMEARYHIVMLKLTEHGKLPVMRGKGKEGFSLKQMLDLTATGNQAQAKSALSGLLLALHGQLNTTQKKGMKAGGQVRRMAAFEMVCAFSAILEQVDRHILPSISKTQPSSMERLYHLKPLDALIFQPASEEVVNGLSFRTSLIEQATAFNLEQALKSASQMRPEATALILHYKNALSQEFGKKWMVFVENLELNSPAKINELYQMVKTLDELQITTLWMGLSTSFLDPSKTDETFSKIKQLFETNLTTFQWLKTESHTIEHLDQTADQWADPIYLEKHIDSLNKIYGNWFSPAGNCLIKQQFDAAGPLGKLATLQFFGRTVNAMDHIIKAVNGSTLYNDDKKVKLFTQFLKTYQQMMSESFSLIPPALKNRWKVHNDCYKIESILREDFNSLCEQIEAGKVTVAEQFVPRGFFNVNTVVIGTKASPQHLTRLEEFFTAFHQNMENAKSALFNTLGLGKETLSPRVKELVGLIEDKFKTPISSINFKEGKAEIDINITLGSHAATIRLIYDPMDPEQNVEISLMAYAPHEHKDRWETLAAAVVVIGHSQPGIFLAQPPRIDYKNLTGMEANLRINKTFKDLPKFVDTLYYLILGVACGDTSAFNLFKHLKSNNLYLPNQLTTQAMIHAPGLLNPIMETSLEKQDFGVALKAATAALIGTAQKGMASYENAADANHYTRNYLFPHGFGYPAIPNGNKLSMNALKCLLELLDQNKISSKDLDPLFADKSVQRTYPEILAALKGALHYYSTAKDKIAILTQAGKVGAAVWLLKFVDVTAEKESCLKLINSKIHELQRSKKDFLIHYCLLPFTQRKEFVGFLKDTKNAYINQIEAELSFWEHVENAKNLDFRTVPEIPKEPIIELFQSKPITDKMFFKKIADFCLVKYFRMPEKYQTEFDSSVSGFTEYFKCSSIIDCKMHEDMMDSIEQNFQGNNRCLAIMCLIEGIKSHDAGIRVEAVNQIKWLQAQMNQLDSIEANFPTKEPNNERKAFRKEIDHVISHFKLN